MTDNCVSTCDDDSISRLKFDLTTKLELGTITDDEAASIELPITDSAHVKMFAVDKKQHGFSYRKAGFHILENAETFDAVTKAVGRKYPGLHSTPYKAGAEFWKYGPICQRITFPTHHENFARLDVTSKKTRCSCVVLVGPEYSLLDFATYDHFGWDWKCNTLLPIWAIQFCRLDVLDQLLQLTEQQGQELDDNDNDEQITKKKKKKSSNGSKNRQFRKKTESAAFSTTFNALELAVTHLQTPVLKWIRNNVGRLIDQDLEGFLSMSSESVTVRVLSVAMRKGMTYEQWQLLSTVGAFNWPIRYHIANALVQEDTAVFRLWCMYNQGIRSTGWFQHARTLEAFAAIEDILGPAYHTYVITNFKQLVLRAVEQELVPQLQHWKRLQLRCDLTPIPISAILHTDPAVTIELLQELLQSWCQNPEEQLALLEYGHKQAYDQMKFDVLSWCVARRAGLLSVDRLWFTLRAEMLVDMMNRFDWNEYHGVERVQETNNPVRWIDITLSNVPENAQVPNAILQVLHTVLQEVSEAALWFFDRFHSLPEWSWNVNETMASKATLCWQLLEGVESLHDIDCEDAAISLRKITQHPWWQARPICLVEDDVKSCIEQMEHLLAPDANRNINKLYCFHMVLGSTGLDILWSVPANKILSEWIQMKAHNNEQKNHIASSIAFLALDCGMSCKLQEVAPLSQWLKLPSPHGERLHQKASEEYEDIISTRIAREIAGQRHQKFSLSTLPKVFDMNALFQVTLCNPRVAEWFQTHYELKLRTCTCSSKSEDESDMSSETYSEPSCEDESDIEESYSDRSE